MKTYDVAIIEGDGIGPEVIQAAIEVLEATDIEFSWKRIELNPESMVHHPNHLPEEILDDIRQCGRALKGPISTPLGTGFVSPNVLLRQQLGLYASIRPIKALLPNLALKPETDLIIVRETTEDLYVMREEAKDGSASAIKVVTKSASERIARKAFEVARTQSKSKVTALHKADILKQTDGLFLESCRKVAKDFPGIDYTESTIDSACTELILSPNQFEVVVAPNMYGDIFSDVAAGLVGGLGLLGSANIGDGPSIYEAVHGSAPKIAGKGIANPGGIIMAAIMMLRDLDEMDAASRIERSLINILGQSAHLTADLGGAASTQEFTQALIKDIKKED